MIRLGRYVVGWLLVGAVSSILLMAGYGKATGTAPAEVQESLTKANLKDWMPIIGGGAIATGLLLAIPWTASIGVLLASSYWGGAIVTHMGLGDSLAPPAGLLVATWVGATLRDPRLLYSLTPRGRNAGDRKELKGEAQAAS